MKQYPIIMSGDHPKLILDGLKTQTRRVIKPQPPPYCDVGEQLVTETWNFYKQVDPDFHAYLKKGCPYGQVGDHLWVRETWAAEKRLDYLRPADIGNAANVPLWWKATIIQDFSMIALERGKWRPSRFMPRWASRITLEITEVRVERVQEITERDAEKEGCRHSHFDPMETDSLRDIFQQLWDSLNAKRGYGWAFNPWVWVISFRRLDGKT